MHRLGHVYAHAIRLDKFSRCCVKSKVIRDLKKQVTFKLAAPEIDPRELASFLPSPRKASSIGGKVLSTFGGHYHLRGIGPLSE